MKSKLRLQLDDDEQEVIVKIVDEQNKTIAYSHRGYSSDAEAIVAYTLLAQSGLARGGVKTEGKSYRAYAGTNNHRLESKLVDSFTHAERLAGELSDVIRRQYSELKWRK